MNEDVDAFEALELIETALNALKYGKVRTASEFLNGIGVIQDYIESLLIGPRDLESYKIEAIREYALIQLKRIRKGEL